MSKVKVPGGFANETVDKFGKTKVVNTQYIGDEKFTFYLDLGSRRENTHGAFYNISVFKEPMTDEDRLRSDKREKDFQEFNEKQAVAELTGAKPTRPAPQSAFKKPAAPTPPVTNKVLEGEDPTMLDDDDLA